MSKGSSSESGADSGPRPDYAPWQNMELSARERLRLILEHDLRNDTLVAGRSRKLNKKHYAAQIGVTPMTVRYHQEIIDRVEAQAVLHTNPLRHLGEMRAWLESQFSSGDLGIRDGKVDRKKCMAAFGIRGGTALVRFPEIAALFAEFDERVKLEKYVSNEMQAEISLLREYLAADPEFTKSKDKLNLKRIAEVLGCSTVKLNSTHLRPVIDDFEETHRSVLKASKVVIKLHRRQWDFAEIETLWSDGFARKVTARFRLWANGKDADTAKGSYLALLSFLRWVPQQADPFCVQVVEEAKRHDRVITSGAWEEVLSGYRESIVAQIKGGDLSRGSADILISNFRISLSIFNNAGAVPIRKNRIRGVKNARRLVQPRPTLIEAAPKGHDERFVEFITRQMHAACTTYGVDLDSGDSSQLVEVLLRSKKRLLTDHIEMKTAVYAHLQVMLRDLYKEAGRILDAAMADYERGKHMLASATIDSKKFAAEYFNSKLSRPTKNALLREYFPKEENEFSDLATSNLLRLVVDLYGGVCPPTQNGEFGQFFAKRYLELGGLGRFERMLGPDPTTCSAVLTLYLIESGANLSVGRTLDDDPCQDSEHDGYKLVTGHKARARGKPIVAYLDAAGDAIRGIEFLKSAGARYRKACDKSDADRLFVERQSNGTQLMTPHRMTGWFKEFTSNIQSLAHLQITPSMIRPSVLLHAALGNDGRLQLGMAIGQHSEAVTQGYQQRLPVRMIYDRYIAQFQRAFETVAIQNIPDAARTLGILAEEFVDRIGSIAATGLGFFCRNSTGRPGSKTTSCETVDCWNECPNMVVVAEVEAFAAMQLWQLSLREAEPVWVRDHPEKWERVWLPWLCFVDVVEEKVKRRFAREWQAARNLVERYRSQPNFAFVKPW